MRIMDCRLQNLQYILEGFSRINIPLIGWNNNALMPFLVGDDIGIYILIPYLVRIFGISLSQAITIFFHGIIALSFIAAFTGFLLLYKTWLPRIIATSWLLVLLAFIVHSHLYDTYLAYLATCLGTIPLFLFFLKKNQPNNAKSLYYFMFSSAIFLGTFHYIRGYSSVAPLLFMGVIIACHEKIVAKNKCILGILLLLGLSIPYCYFTYCTTTYKSFAAKQWPDLNIATQHPFWHQIYIGFGFLSCFNDDKITYADECGFKKVQERNPSLTIPYTEQYESVLKNEIIRLIKEKPFFVLYTLFAKIGVLLLYLFLFANSGLLAALLFPKVWYLESAFLCALLFNSIFSLLSIPSHAYSLGFITLSVLYGIISLNTFIESKSSFLTRALKVAPS